MGWCGRPSRVRRPAGGAFARGRETRETSRLYGLDDRESAETGACCLLARRLVERGVRFVQVRVGGWDAHGNLRKNHDPQARKSDRPIAGLLTDLKRRGPLEGT